MSVFTPPAADRTLSVHSPQSRSVIGPLAGDPLWTSWVVVFIQEGEKVRLNSLVMPHARITGKGTALLSADRYKEWLDGVIGTEFPQKEPEKPRKGEKEANAFERNFLLAVWDTEGKRLIYTTSLNGEKDDGKARKALMERYNAVLKEVKSTYP